MVPTDWQKCLSTVHPFQSINSDRPARSAGAPIPIPHSPTQRCEAACDMFRFTGVLEKFAVAYELYCG